MSLPRPPMIMSLPPLPVIVSSPSPPLITRLIRPALSADASMVSLPPRPLMVSVSLAPSACAIVTCAASPLTVTAPPLLAILMASSPAVPLTMTLSGWPSPLVVPEAARSIGNLRYVGSGQIVDRDGVGATGGIELNVLDAVEVHGDVADVAEQPHPAAVGRDVDVLVGVGAVEHQRVGAGLAFDRVAAVAGVPDELVVAVAEKGDVIASAPRDRRRCRRHRSACPRRRCR